MEIPDTEHIIRKSPPSTRAKLFAAATRKIMRRQDAKEGHSPFLDSMTYTPYHFGSWSPPKGYNNTLICLSNCQAYLLKHKSSPSAKVVYQLHGGAYKAAYSEMYDKNAVNLSRSFDDADVLSLDYRVADQAPFPAALEDALDGYQWLLTQGYTPQNIVVSGESAGGGLAVALMLKLRDDCLPLPRCLVIGSPWADLAQSGESYSANRKVDILFGSDRPNAAQETVLPTDYAQGNSLTNPYISPIYADLHGLPPTLILTGESEMLLGLV